MIIFPNGKQAMCLYCVWVRSLLRSTGLGRVFRGVRVCIYELHPGPVYILPLQNSTSVPLTTRNRYVPSVSLFSLFQNFVSIFKVNSFNFAVCVCIEIFKLFKAIYVADEFCLMQTGGSHVVLT